MRSSAASVKISATNALTAQTDIFFGPLDAQNKHKIVKRYMRNDFVPVVITEVAKDLAPRVVYTLL